MSDLLGAIFELVCDFLFCWTDSGLRLSSRFGLLFGILSLISLGAALLAMSPGHDRRMLLIASPVLGLLAIGLLLIGERPRS
jgi:hypothetical protein